MKFSNLLSDLVTPLVIDTSVLINLYACGRGAFVLSTIPNVKIISQLVVDEFNRGKEAQKIFLAELIANGLVSVSEMTDTEYEVFADLTTIDPTIGDGEAATIAIAITRKFFVIMDDGKGRKRTRALAPSFEPGWSIDLLRHSPVVAALQSTEVLEVVYMALSIGRMQIPNERLVEIIDLIGLERALLCPSLPGHKERKTNSNSKRHNLFLA